jgi:hypothetical protein
VTGTRTRNSSTFLIVLLTTLLSPTARAEEMVPVRPDASFTLRTGIAQGKMVYTRLEPPAAISWPIPRASDMKVAR